MSEVASARAGLPSRPTMPAAMARRCSGVAFDSSPPDGAAGAIACATAAGPVGLLCADMSVGPGGSITASGGNTPSASGVAGPPCPITFGVMACATAARPVGGAAGGEAPMNFLE